MTGERTAREGEGRGNSFESEMYAETSPKTPVN